MSKIIKITQEHIDTLRQEFEKTLLDAKVSDGKLNFVRSFSDTGLKADLYFMESAWLKMQKLVQGFDIEIGWYGVAHRVEDEESAYCVTDILVYPQNITATTVDMDTDKCAEWFFENREDERFDNIHFQGHSHVNMSTSPSGVDIGHQQDILDMLDDEGFYIFLIINKRGEKNLKIYDMQKNVLFEQKDITVSIIEEIGLEKFLEEAKNVAVKKTVSTATAPSSYSGAYNGYYGGSYSGYQANSKPTAPTYYSAPNTTTAPQQKKDEPKSGGSDGVKPVHGKKKGKRIKNKYQSGAKSSVFQDGDDPYNPY